MRNCTSNYQYTNRIKTRDLTWTMLHLVLCRVKLPVLGFSTASPTRRSLGNVIWRSRRRTVGMSTKLIILWPCGGFNNYFVRIKAHDVASRILARVTVKLPVPGLSTASPTRRSLGDVIWWSRRRTRRMSTNTYRTYLWRRYWFPKQIFLFLQHVFILNIPEFFWCCRRNIFYYIEVWFLVLSLQ